MEAEIGSEETIKRERDQLKAKSVALAQKVIVTGNIHPIPNFLRGLCAML